jgi:hypothetical protein
MDRSRPPDLSKRISSGDCRRGPRDLFDGLLRLAVLATHAYHVGLRDDADQGTALVDDRDAPNLLAPHQRHGVVDGVVGRAGLHAARHHLTHGRVGRASLRHMAHGDVAIGHDTNETAARLRAADALDDGHETHVLLLHHARRFRHRRIRRDGAGVLRHDLGHFHWDLGRSDESHSPDRRPGRATERQATCRMHRNRIDSTMHSGEH